MANVLSEEKKQQVVGLGRLGWPLRRIEEATGIRRETASRYLKAAGISIRFPGGWGRRPPPKAAKEALTDSRRVAEANRPKKCTPTRRAVKWPEAGRRRGHPSRHAARGSAAASRTARLLSA